MNSICEDIKDMLVAAPDLDFTFGENLFIAHIPISPINMVALYDTSAGAPQNTLGGGVICNDTFQVIVRNATYDDAYSLAIDVRDYLDSIINQVVNNTRYLGVILISGPAQLTQETSMKRGLTELSINFTAKRTES